MPCQVDEGRGTKPLFPSSEVVYPVELLVELLEPLDSVGSGGMGAEDVGLSADSLRRCDDLVGIPMKGKVNSLNVSVAAGIMIYEAVRQRMNAGVF